MGTNILDPAQGSPPSYSMISRHRSYMCTKESRSRNETLNTVQNWAERLASSLAVNHLEVNHRRPQRRSTGGKDNMEEKGGETEMLNYAPVGFTDPIHVNVRSRGPPPPRLTLPRRTPTPSSQGQYPPLPSTHTAHSSHVEPSKTQSNLVA